jgi:glycerol-3-phosphate acyltransferase PlsY
MHVIAFAPASWAHAFIALGLGYLLGSIPFGLIITRLAGTQDIREIGSGNIGATNVLRTGHKGLAAATLLCDMLKGTLAVVLAAKLFGRDASLVAGLGAFLGHLFPIWLRFKGGKGVATFVGILIAFAWKATLAFAVVWGAVAYLSRYSSLSSLAASAATPAVLWFLGLKDVALLFVILAALVFIMHHANIGRLIAGTETKIGSRAVKT